MVFLAFYNQNEGTKEDYKIFFINERIKNNTIQTLSQINDIKKEIYINSTCKNIFMEFCISENNILGKIKMEKDLLKYFELINENFYVLRELIKTVSLNSYFVEGNIVKLGDDLDKIYQIYKLILSKEIEIKNFFLRMDIFMEKSIDVFKNIDLNNLICLIKFIEDEKQNNNSQEFKGKIFYIEKKLKEEINNTLKLYIKSNLNSGIYYLDIIPKIGNYFTKYEEDDKFKVLEAGKIGREKNENLIQKFQLMISHKLYKYFISANSYSKFYNNIIIKNVKGIEYLDYILQIFPEEDYNFDMSLKLFDWVKKYIGGYSSKLNIDIKQGLSKVLSILIKKKKEKIDDFLKLFHNMSDALIIEIYIYFLENNNLEPNNKDKNIMYFLNNKKNIFKANDSTIIPYILSKLQDKKDINLVLNKLKVIKEEEFYKQEITENIKILNDLLQNNYFEKLDKKNTNEYIQKTLFVFETVKSNFEQKTFNYEKAYNIYENIISNKDILYKFKLLLLLKEDKDNSI